MVALYATAVILGALGLSIWVVLGVVAEREGAQVVAPERRFGLRGRSVLVAVLGFGLGGMSASYAGWPTAVAFAAAVSGAGLLVASGRHLGVGGDGV
jgi:hypothetical protein